MLVPTKQVGDNTRWKTDLVEVLNRTKTPALLMRLDAQKNFDILGWPCMFPTLACFAFRGPFLMP